MDKNLIKRRYELLNAQITALHDQIQGIADREAGMAQAVDPLPYSNPYLTQLKAQLVEASRKAIEAMEQLQQALDADDDADV
jgi:hypothetical protein